MPKRLIIVPLLCGLFLFLAACGNYTIPDDTSPPSQAAEENPFQAAEDEAGFLAALSHQAAEPDFSESGERLPFEYGGGEFQLKYQYSVTGKLDTVGFLLFLNGKPQPYKVDHTEADYAYCHIFTATEEQTFSFLFEPVTGSVGDLLTLTVVSITNPDFQPDMESTTGYGWYHKTLDSSIQIRFNENAPATHPGYPSVREIFSESEAHEEKITAQYVETELPKHGWGGVSMDTLESGVYYTLSYDGNIVYDNLCIGQPVTLRYTMCGAAGKNYQVTFFLDHQPVKIGEDTSCSVTWSKGGIIEIEAIIDPVKLGQFSTFYCVAVPQDGTSGTLFKSNSILLYKEK